MTSSFLATRLRSMQCAGAGIAHLVRTQRNAWIHLAASAAVIAAGASLHLIRRDWCWLIVAMAAVWVAEALNTALELLADATCPQQHVLVGRAKDVAAGGVLLAAVGALAIGVCIFVPYL